MKIIQQKKLSTKYQITICLILSAQILGPVHTTEHPNYVVLDEEGCRSILLEDNISVDEEYYYIPCGTCLVAGGVGSVALATTALPALGFTAIGVASGSVAAFIQSAFYGGATTGVFSALQSAGAAGLGFSGSLFAGGIGVAGAAGKMCHSCKCLFKSNKDLSALEIVKLAIEKSMEKNSKKEE